MSKYSYKLYKQNRPVATYQKHYRYSELSNMTTYQLRDICCKERLIKSVLDPLNREELIRLIMRYRGKSEASFIKTYNEEGFERLSQFIQNTKLLCDNTKTLKVPAKIAIYQDLEVSIHDAYEVTCKETLNEGNVLLVNEDYEICTIFNLVELGKDRYYLTKTKVLPIKKEAKKQYSLLYFEQTESDLLYNLYYGIETHVPAYIKHCKAPILELSIKTLRETELPLVIDFGTSNTTAGIYEETIKYVKVLGESKEETPIIPSVVAIKSIKEEKIEYAFGYEAIALFQKSYLDEEMPIFYDIKRWISNPERVEKLTAIDGHYTLVQRKEILKAYLQYIIDLGKQRFKYNFKNIQLLAPVRQKERFIALFKEVLEEYKVRCEIDEGMAVVFNTIRELIAREKYKQNKWYEALIIDCGGGTTDLVAAKFKIENHRVAYTIDLESSYENGDTNFGGNNLTYRIMQLLKIRLVNSLRKEEEWCQDYLDMNVYRLVDEQGKEQVYEALNKAYNVAEEVLPTHFKNYEGSNLETYFKIKSNYYYLFELAEQIKRVFYKNHALYELHIGNDIQLEKRLHTMHIPLDKWKLSYYEENELKFIPNIDEIVFYLYEIKALLKADVYSLMKKFLEELYENEQLFDYEMIKLTGQSCQVDLFKETLKEFIPGRLVGDYSGQKENYELKLGCLKGALQYLSDSRMGYIEMNQYQEIGALPYELISYTHENKEKVLSHSLYKEEETGSISRFIKGTELKLYLKSPNGELLKVYHHKHAAKEFHVTTYKEINETYPNHIIQDETDNIVNGETKYFVWVERQSWGFYVLPIFREDDKLYSGRAIFYDFEDDTWELNFFDGLK